MASLDGDDAEEDDGGVEEDEDDDDLLLFGLGEEEGEEEGDDEDGLGGGSSGGRGLSRRRASELASDPASLFEAEDAAGGAGASGASPAFSEDWEGMRRPRSSGGGLAASPLARSPLHIALDAFWAEQGVWGADARYRLASRAGRGAHPVSEREKLFRDTVRKKGGHTARGQGAAGLRPARHALWDPGAP